MVVAVVVGIVIANVAPFPCCIGTAIISTEYFPQTAGYLNVITSSSTDRHSKFCISEIINILYVYIYMRFSLGTAGTVVVLCRGCTFNF